MVASSRSSGEAMMDMLAKPKDSPVEDNLSSLIDTIQSLRTKNPYTYRNGWYWNNYDSLLLDAIVCEN